jgi:alpha-glucoside transport system substrate-binding protein
MKRADETGPMRRRDAIKVLTLPALAAGCGIGRGGIRVAGVWSGWELTQFRKVLDAFPGLDSWSISVQSAGDDIAALVGNRVAGTAAPNVALVPFPQLVRDNRDHLVPLRPEEAADSEWDRLLTFDGEVYGYWFKVAHKSLVWYRPDLLGAEPPPRDWGTWLALCRDLAARGRPPLSIGAADGWVLTDWFENVLLSLDSAGYRALATGRAAWRHPSVRAALRRLGEMWSIPGVVAGGAERALQTQFDQSLLDVFRYGRAAMVAGADFAWPFITQYTFTPPDEIEWFAFPPIVKRPVLVGGDAAVLLRPATEGGRELITWLATPRAAGRWAGAGGFLTINDPARGVAYPPGLNARPLIDDVVVGSGDGGQVTFDLSDQLGGRLTGAEGRGTWKIFKDFFVEVTTPRSAGEPPADRTDRTERAVERAVTALDAAAKGSA